MITKNETMNCSIENDKVKLDLEGIPDSILTQGSPAHELNSFMYDNIDMNARPWGTFEILKEFKGSFGQVKIKRIIIDPGEVLSQQYHNHRSEHWICLQGAGRYQNNATEGTIRAGESVYIPVGKIHRLENIGVIPLEILEVQLGESVAEEDIVRLEDKYGRCK